MVVRLFGWAALGAGLALAGCPAPAGRTGATNATKVEGTPERAGALRRLRVGGGLPAAGFGVARPRPGDDAAAFGFVEPTPVDSLVVIAQEHPDHTPPELAVQTLGDREVLVLTWLEKPADHVWTAIPDGVYGWSIPDPAPRALLVRRVAKASDMLAPLASSTGAAAKPRRLTAASASGAGVTLAPCLPRDREGLVLHAPLRRPRA